MHSLHQGVATLTTADISRVAGFLPSTMLDWPGRLASTVFVSGCPFRCPYCHNPGLLDPCTDPTPLSELSRCLADRRSWIDGVVVTGGEPTAHEGIWELLLTIKGLGLPVRLDTNGYFPETLSSLIQEGLVDCVAMDVKTVADRYEDVSGAPDASVRVRKSVDVVLDSGIEHEFRTTAHPDCVTTADLISIASSLASASSYVIQQFRPGSTLSPDASETSCYTQEQLRDVALAACDFVPTAVRGVTSSQPGLG